MIFRSFIFSLALTSSSIAQITRLPEEFFIQERLFSFFSTFDVITDLEQIAIATKKLFSLSTSFELDDMSSSPLAFGSTRLFKWGTVADITDSGGQKIGCIEEEIWRIFPWAEYRLLNALDEVVAIAKMDCFGTEFSLFHPDFPDHIYATISRPLIHFFRDSWTVRITDYQAFEKAIIDPRLLVMLAIYQTDKDNRDRWRALIENQIFNEISEQEGLQIGF